MKRQSFALMELLLVVAVAALAFTLLLPRVYRQLRSLGTETVCQDNLRKFGVGLAAYVDENEGFTPEAIPGSGSRRNWYKLLAPNLDPLPGMVDWNNPGLVKGEFGIFRCPENREQIYISNFHGPQDNKTQSYGANTFSGLNENRYMGNSVDNFKYPSRLVALFEANYGRCVAWTDKQNDSPERVSELRHQGRMSVLMADGQVRMNEGVLKYRGAFKGGTAERADSYENGALWYAQ